MRKIQFSENLPEALTKSILFYLVSGTEHIEAVYGWRVIVGKISCTAKVYAYTKSIFPLEFVEGNILNDKAINGINSDNCFLIERVFDSGKFRFNSAKKWARSQINLAEKWICEELKLEKIATEVHIRPISDARTFNDITYNREIKKTEETKKKSKRVSIKMNYPLSAYSWNWLSDTVAVKEMDKSVFLHHGTAIPKEILSFFGFENEISGRRLVNLKVENDYYEAYFQAEKRLNKVRLFWKSNFSNLIKLRFPEVYENYKMDTVDIKSPQMRFLRLRLDLYVVSFSSSLTMEFDWTDDELEAAVVAYFQMLNKEKSGHKINKSEVSRYLRMSILSGRSKGSIEYRMQNISTILNELCHPIIKGYLPRGNVGTEVSSKIKNIMFTKGLLRVDIYNTTYNEKELDDRVEAILKKGLNGKPKGQINLGLTWLGTKK